MPFPPVGTAPQRDDWMTAAMGFSVLGSKRGGEEGAAAAAAAAAAAKKLADEERSGLIKEG